MYWSALYLVVTTLLTIALAPRPPTPKAAGITDFSLPTADQGRNIPVLFGTGDITGSNCVWYGALQAIPMRQKSLFSSQTTGYQYTMGIHLVLGHGPFDTINNTKWDQKLTWIGSQAVSGQICMVNLNLFGGMRSQGGIQGCFDVIMGTDTEPMNTYLAATLGSVPAYRGVVSMVWKSGIFTALATNSDFSQSVTTFRGGYIGTSPYVKSLSFNCTRIVNGWNIAGGCWYSAKATVNHAVSYTSPPSWSPTFIAAIFGTAVTSTGQSTIAYDVTNTNFTMQTQGFLFIGSEWIYVTSVGIQSDGAGGFEQSGVMNVVRGFFGTTAGASYPINTTYDFYDANTTPTLAMNAAHIVYQCLTDPRWGMGLSPAQLDDTAFRAAADLFFNENMGLCMQWVNATSVEDFLRIVLNHCAASLVMNNATGLYQLVPIRGGYNLALLPTFDQTNIKEMTEYDTQGWADETNQVVLIYTDPFTGRDTAITGQDISNIDLQGKVVSQSVNYQGIRDHALAQDVLGREMSSRCTPLVKVRFQINRYAFGTASGGLFLLTWPARNVTNLVMRVTSIDKGTLRSNTITVDAVQDIYSLGLYNYSITTGKPQDQPLTPGQITVITTPPPSQGPTVISSTTTSPPGSPADGAQYIVPIGATGVWAGHAGQVAVWDAQANLGVGAWEFLTIPVGAPVLDQGSGGYVTVNSGGTVIPFVLAGGMDIIQIQVFGG